MSAAIEVQDCSDSGCRRTVPRVMLYVTAAGLAEGLLSAGCSFGLAFVEVQLREPWLRQCHDEHDQCRSLAPVAHHASTLVGSDRLRLVGSQRRLVASSFVQTSRASLQS